MDSCVWTILGYLTNGVISQGDYLIRQGTYVIQYKNQVHQLEQANKRLGEKKERIQGMVDRATNKGEVIETEVSSWLEEVEQMEGDIDNFLRQQEDGESFRCFPGCMCRKVMWRHKRGMEADKRKLDVSELISRGERLEQLPVAHNESFQSELHFDSPQYYTTFQSRASVVEEIKNALKNSGVDVIGVHGPGGAGKTTMVTEVAKEAKALGIFDEFVIAVVSKDPNTSKIQKELASQLDFNYEQRSELGRANELRKALLNGKRKILVILDDLWQVLGLNAIGIPTSGLGDRGCKILLTSRNEEVLEGMGVHLRFPIGYLEKPEAWELFTKVTGDFRVHQSIAEKISERCGGLPIAIVVVGATLKGKEEAVWKNALHQLQRCPINYIEGIQLEPSTPLKWSYDFLKERDAKSCFLLCCLFPEDAEISIDDLVRYSFALGFLRMVDRLEAARYRVQAMVDMLKRSCLLLNGKNKNFVKMHDVIRDLAISITEEKQAEHVGGRDWPGQQQFKVNHNIQEWPNNDALEHHTAISLRINDDNIQFPSSVLHCPLMHTLVLNIEQDSLQIPNHFFQGIEQDSLQIPNHFFQGMKEARVLDLDIFIMNLPSSVLELDHLRMLRLKNCQLSGDLSTIQNLKNHIEILSFEGSTIEELPQEIGKLTRLRSLDLRECRSLEVIPKGVISNLIHLEELYVTESFQNWDTTIDDGGMSNASIAELKSLNQLIALHVGISTESYRIMVQECRGLFERLINFAIFINRYSSSGNESRNILAIVDIHKIDDEFCLLMDRVEDLLLSNIQDLGYLRGKPQLQFTPSGGNSFCKLIDLRISCCHSMKYLFSPSYAKAFPQLKKLAVHDCSRMEQIIGVGDHCNEEDLNPNIQSPTIKFKLIDVFPKLRDLKLHYLPKLRKIWLNDEDYCSNDNYDHLYLQAISIKYCGSLRHAFSAFVARHLACLERLHVKTCLGMEVIISAAMGEGVTDDGIIEFCQLKTLKLKDLPNLKSFYQSKSEASHLFNHQVIFPKIESLYLTGLESSREILVLLWNKNLHEIGSLRSLKNIDIISCSQLRSLFTHSMATSLQHLESLSVSYCDMMEEIIIIEENNINFVGEEKTTRHIEFPKLEWLSLCDLKNLKNFCSDERGSFSFPSLSCIEVYRCPQMKLLDKFTCHRGRYDFGKELPRYKDMIGLKPLILMHILSPE